MEGFSSRDLTSLGQVIGSRLGGQFKKISFCYDNLRLRFRDVRIRKGKKCHVQSNLLESVSVKDSVVQCYKLESLGQGSAPCTSSLKTILQSRNSNLRLSCLFGVLMASSAGGGDKGIITAMVAHPKPAGGGEIVMANQREEVLNKGTLAIGVATPDENQTTMEGAGTAVEVDSTTHQGPAAFIEGEVVEEDEDAIEVDCDKRGANVENPFRFSADLRCSPLKPFERKVNKVRAMQNTGAARNLFFRGAGSAGSSSSKQRDVEQWDEAIPPRVDAHDNFDDKEKEGDSSVDEQLVLQANLMNMAGTEGIDKEHDDSQGPKLKSGSNVVALAGSAGEAIPSKEMIPAIANLQQQASFGDGSSDDWSGGNRKRMQDTTEINKPGRVQQALVIYQSATVKDAADSREAGKDTRALKRSRKTEGGSEVSNSEATSHGAAGKLTGPMIGSRQEQ
ncbi:hypothetical protein OsJ_23162 [Oryza sativa Japonica Group]|uniref:Uncharacterized protein n=1 Tax=Oryza sativa subsp. japonica TaxID=39947 RepID=B9FVL1_ORYSJ|nr:hypothetical protein OsJ_23162 [Oryza sativa Japonica Group]